MRVDFKLRGPDGVRARMAEIQSRLDAVFPDSPLQQPASSPSGLSGQIGPFNPFGGGVSVRSLQTPEQLRAMIKSAAQAAGIDEALFDALVAVESGYDPNARSSAGAMGLSQLMPGTARELGVTNPFDPAQNLNGGAKYLASMLQRFGGDFKLALAAYNAGPGAVERHNGIPPYAQTQAYVQKVLALYAEKRR